MAFNTSQVLDMLENESSGESEIDEDPQFLLPTTTTCDTSSDEEPVADPFSPDLEVPSSTSSRGKKQNKNSEYQIQ